jgi:hypothetical protein
MSEYLGLIYVLSLVYLAFVVVSVYSAAQEPFAPARDVFRHGARRAVKLLGVLVILAVVVLILSHIGET